MNSLVVNGLIASVFFLLMCISTLVQAQGRMTIHAVVQGTGTQQGQMYDVHIHIEQFSTPVDRQKLLDAFARSGQDGLVDVLGTMNPKGNVRFTNGGLGNDVKYIIELPSEKGRRIRLITDRNISYGEAFSGTSSRNYNIGAIELLVTADGKKASGKIFPACMLKLDEKTKQISIESYQNPWSLTSLTITYD